MSYNKGRTNTQIVDATLIKGLADLSIVNAIRNLQQLVKCNAREVPKPLQTALSPLLREGITELKMGMVTKALKQFKQERNRRERANKPAQGSFKSLEPCEVNEDQFTSPDVQCRYEELVRKTGKSMEEIEKTYRSLMDDDHYRNDIYHVILRRMPMQSNMSGPDMIHISVKRHDQEAIFDWRDMQRIKNQLLSDEHEAVQLFPAESRMVDTANQYHMWAYDDVDFRWPIGWDEGVVKLDEVEGLTGQREFD